MTKRLFAIVLAAVLAITMFTFPMFATESVRATLTKDGTKLTLTFNKGSDVSANKVVLNFYVGNSTTPVGNPITITDMAKTSYDYSTTTGGVYHAQVVYYNGSQILATAESGTQTIPITSSGTNMKVIYDENGIRLEFNAQSNATAYTAVYTYKSGNTTMNGQPQSLPYTTSNGKVTANFSPSVSYSDLVSIKLYVGTPNSYSTSNFASWGNTSSSGGSSSSNNLTVSGNVTAEIVNGYIVGTISYNSGFTSYRIGVATTGSGYQYSSASSSRSFSVPIYSTYNMHIIVQGTSNIYGSWQTIGDIVYSYNGGGSLGSGNVALNNYNGNLVLSWAPVTGAVRYIVRYQGNNISSGSQYVDANTTYWTVPFLSVTNSFTLSVVAQMPDGSYRDIGTTGSNYGSSSYPYYPNYGQTSGGTVTQGSNCTVTSYSNYAYVQWVSTGASRYVVVVYRDGDTQGSTQFVDGGMTYTQIPISNAYNYTIQIFDGTNSYYYSPIATATVKAQATLQNNSSIKKTTIKNLKVTPLNSYTTAISWDKDSSANYYVAIYGLLSGGATEELPVYRGDTSINIPFGSTTPYQVTVYAVDVNGRRSQVGYVYNVPGTTADNDSTGKDYPAELTAKSLNKKIKLSWKEVDDASYYTIYYKRSTSSSWNKIDTRVTKTVVNISGLTNEIDYDFKVIPNKGSESGIVTIAPSTTSRTVTARDPSSSSSGDGDVNLEDDELTVTSVSSTSKGKIKVTWSNVGAPSYKIYVAEGNSNSYKACGTYTGTSATISTFGTGSKATSFKSGKTYKVRVVRTDYTGSIQTALKACPLKTVTVK